MDVTDLVKNVGIPMACLTALGFAVWRVLVWTGSEVVKPVVARHISFLDALEKGMEKMAVRQEAAMESLMMSGKRLEQMAGDLGEVRKVVIRADTVTLMPNRQDNTGAGIQQAPPPH